MPAASRVQLVPPGSWDEARLIEATRAVAATEKPVRPGDAVGDLVVVAVDPEPGATLCATTEIEVVPEPRSSAAALVDVAILLDVSESMATAWSAQHTRLAAARESLTAFLKSPGPSIATVSIIEYAKGADLVAGPSPPAELTLEKTRAPAGRSATGTALNAALAHLAARSTPERAQVVFLLTDGVGEVPELRAAAERAARLRVPVHSLVFAPALDEIFHELAQVSHGSAQTASLPLTIEFVHEPGAPIA